ncbi:hypothetical protein BC792_1248 [Sphingobacterium allocomposti]|uniref:Uncharacterized protein n=1 Tax=Sphingobacterium allocomposti TaxID=415956 RepID=A0A5S5D4K6_9SPHI|nr:hypothetical protein BC792_1248 [Sphingobacterium composti Yoo et al. 2007 non Ten et al. 2007]
MVLQQLKWNYRLIRKKNHLQEMKVVFIYAYAKIIS